jgi:hypothetical protein
MFATSSGKGYCRVDVGKSQPPQSTSSYVYGAKVEAITILGFGPAFMQKSIGLLHRILQRYPTLSSHSLTIFHMGNPFSWQTMELDMNFKK